MKKHHTISGNFLLDASENIESVNAKNLLDEASDVWVSTEDAYLLESQKAVCEEWLEWDEQKCLKVDADGNCVSWVTFHRKKCVKWRSE